MRGSLSATASKFGGAARGFKMFSPLVAGGVVVLYAASDHFSKGSNFLSVLAVGLVVIGAALFAGLLFGFLFGLPKSVETQAQSNTKRLLATNTNLDQISDWLTKILVGVGLVQLGKLAHGVSKLGDAIAPGLGGGSGAKPVAVALVVYSVVDGFLIGYIWSRVDLSARFQVAAQNLAADDFLSAAQTVRTPEQLPPPPA